MSNKFEIIKDDDTSIPADIVPSILKGLDQARRHLAGETVEGIRVHHIEIPEPDVSQIREQTGLSQTAFAGSIGVSVGTLRGWEQGRRKPEGPARVLLALIAKNPNIVQEELAG